MQKGRIPPKEWLAANKNAGSLVDATALRLINVLNELSTELASMTGGNFSRAQRNHDAIDAAVIPKAGYTPDFEAYDMALQISLNIGRPDALIISFHGIGPRFRGLIGVVAYLNIQGAEPMLIEGGTFQINYAEDLASAETRFTAWLDRVIVAGLNAWRLTL